MARQSVHTVEEISVRSTAAQGPIRLSRRSEQPIARLHRMTGACSHANGPFPPLG